MGVKVYSPIPDGEDYIPLFYGERPAFSTALPNTPGTTDYIIRFNSTNGYGGGSAILLGSTVNWTGKSIDDCAIALPAGHNRVSYSLNFAIQFAGSAADTNIVCDVRSLNSLSETSLSTIDEPITYTIPSASSTSGFSEIWYNRTAIMDAPPSYFVTGMIIPTSFTEVFVSHVRLGISTKQV